MSDEVQASTLKAQYTPGLAKLSWKDRSGYLATVAAVQKGELDNMEMITQMDVFIEKVAGKPAQELSLDEGNAIQELIVECFQGNTAKQKN